MTSPRALETQIPDSVFAPQPEMAVSIPTPAEEFTAQVAEVRTHGDIIDNRRFLFARDVGMVATAACVAANTCFRVENGLVGVTLGITVFSSVICAGQTLRRRRDVADVKKARQQIREELGEKLNMHYDLLRVKEGGRREVAMYWHGPFDRTKDPERPGADRLRETAELARDAGIEKLIIGGIRANLIFRAGLPGKSQLEKDWIKEQKKLDLDEKKVAERTLFIASPDEWLQALDNPDNLIRVPERRARSSVKVTQIAPIKAARLQAGGVPQGLAGKEIVQVLPLVRSRAGSSVVRQLGAKQGEFGPNAINAEEEVAQSTRKGVAALGIMFVAGVAMAGQYLGDKQYDVRVDEARLQIADEHKVSKDDLQVTDHALAERVDSWNPAVNGTWKQWRSIRSWPGIVENSIAGLREGESGGASGPGLSPDGAGVGNVPNGRDATPVWKITPHGLDPKGFWVQSTSNLLQFPLERDGTVMRWNTTEAMTSKDRDQRLLPSTPPADYGATLEVERMVTEKDTTKALFGKGAAETYIFMPVPILPGTIPVASMWGGKPRPVLSGSNGTYGFVFPVGDAPGRKGSEFRYWLAKDPAGRAGVKSLGETRMNGHSRFSITNPKAVFDTLVPNYASATTQKERTRILTAYLQQEFHYAYEPLKRDRFGDDVDESSDIARIILEGKRANCNVALAELVMQDQTLNGAFGYENSNPATINELNASEAHAKALTKDSTFIDPTPQGSVLVTDGKPRSHEGSGSHLPNPADVPGGLLGVLELAGLGAYAMRRRLNRMGARIAKPFKVAAERAIVRRADHADAKLRHLDPDILVAAAEAVQHARWRRPSRLAAAPERLDQVASQSRLTPKAAYELLVAPIYHTKRVSTALKQAPRQLRRAIRLAIKANRRPVSPEHRS
jgi:hypothetical protein